MPDAPLPNGNSEGIKKSSNSFSQTTVLTVGYVAVSVVSVVMIARIVLFLLQPKRLVAEDYCVFLAYASFVSQCALYIAIAPLSDRVVAVQEGRAPYYPELIDEGFLLGRLYFPALIIFWIILWLVKFNLLFLYRKLLVGVSSVYNKIWWFIVVFCAIITANTIQTDADTDGTWLAVWGMAECAVGRNAIRKPDADEQEVQLTTIGGSGGSGNRKEKLSETWLAMDDNQEELATTHDAASGTTSACHEEGSLDLRR
ncbi:hypothetical protein J4E91_004833 [Alternaria rosae]|nr:hypothetical protein J4E91_004833 [Alternaria rosae]